MLEILGEELNAKDDRATSATNRSSSSGASGRCCPRSASAWARGRRRSSPPRASNEVEYLPDGGVRLAGVDLAADEVEILATPRAGTAVAHDKGLVVVIDTELDDELRAEGDARELTRAVQDLRKQAGLELDEHDRPVARALPGRCCRHSRRISAGSTDDTLAESAQP